MGESKPCTLWLDAIAAVDIRQLCYLADHLALDKYIGNNHGILTCFGHYS
jgi:hypothetical protein